VKMTRSARTLEEILAICLDDLQAGMTSAECLARYPEYADQLKPLLLTAERLQNQAWPTLSTNGRVRGRERMHAALASRRPAGFAWGSGLRPLFAAVLLLVLAGGVWLAWPSRLPKNTDRPTSAPVLLRPTTSPAFTQTPTPTLTLTPTLTPTGTAAAANPVSTETDDPAESDGPKAPFATATLRTRNTATSEGRAKLPTSTGSPTVAVTAGPPGPQQTPQGDDGPKATEQAPGTRTPSGATAEPSRTREPEESSTPHPTATGEFQSHATATRVPTKTPSAALTPEATSTPDPTEAPELTKTPGAAGAVEPTKTPDHY
jgi:hypothetical protein